MAGFKIGSTLGGIQALEDILSPSGNAYDPDWSFQDFAGSQELNDGTVKGQGFAVAKWRWNHLSNVNRAVFRGLCPGLSAVVYIETKTNEIDPVYDTEEWGIFRAVMRWMDVDEDKAAVETLGVIFTFTHLELQP